VSLDDSQVLDGAGPNPANLGRPQTQDSGQRGGGLVQTIRTLFSVQVVRPTIAIFIASGKSVDPHSQTELTVLTFCHAAKRSNSGGKGRRRFSQNLTIVAISSRKNQRHEFAEAF
jgi:hypothetical protein